MHAGFAIQVIDEEEARITSELLKEVLYPDDVDSKGNKTGGGLFS